MTSKLQRPTQESPSYISCSSTKSTEDGILDVRYSSHSRQLNADSWDVTSFPNIVMFWILWGYWVVIWDAFETGSGIRILGIFLGMCFACCSVVRSEEGSYCKRRVYSAVLASLMTFTSDLLYHRTAFLSFRKFYLDICSLPYCNPKHKLLYQCLPASLPNHHHCTKENSISMICNTLLYPWFHRSQASTYLGPYLSQLPCSTQSPIDSKEETLTSRVMM